MSKAANKHIGEIVSKIPQPEWSPKRVAEEIEKRADAAEKKLKDGEKLTPEEEKDLQLKKELEKEGKWNEEGREGAWSPDENTDQISGFSDPSDTEPVYEYDSEVSFDPQEDTGGPGTMSPPSSDDGEYSPPPEQQGETYEPPPAEQQQEMPGNSVEDISTTPDSVENADTSPPPAAESLNENPDPAPESTPDPSGETPMEDTPIIRDSGHQPESKAPEPLAEEEEEGEEVSTEQEEILRSDGLVQPDPLGDESNNPVESRESTTNNEPPSAEQNPEQSLQTSQKDDPFENPLKEFNNKMDDSIQKWQQQQQDLEDKVRDEKIQEAWNKAQNPNQTRMGGEEGLSSPEEIPEGGEEKPEGGECDKGKGGGGGGGQPQSGGGQPPGGGQGEQSGQNEEANNQDAQQPKDDSVLTEAQKKELLDNLNKAAEKLSKTYQEGKIDKETYEDERKRIIEDASYYYTKDNISEDHLMEIINKIPPTTKA